MKFTICFLLIFMLVGCIAPRVQVSDISEDTESFVPPWDERIAQDFEDTDESKIAEEPKKSMLDMLNQDNIGYHFRRTRWGFSRERVELSEVGNTVLERTPQVLVYRCKINDVNCHLIYTFEKNKLRTAGYSTIAPVPDAHHLRKAVVDKYGPPDGQQTYEDGPNEGLREMIWTTADTVIFSNLYPTVSKETQTPYDYTDGGLLKDLIARQQSETQAGSLVYYTGVHAHVDKAFFYKLQTLRYPLDELTSYEKQLMGVTVKGKRTIIPGLGTIPQ